MYQLDVVTNMLLVINASLSTALFILFQLLADLFLLRMNMSSSSWIGDLEDDPGLAFSISVVEEALRGRGRGRGFGFWLGADIFR